MARRVMIILRSEGERKERVTLMVSARNLPTPKVPMREKYQVRILFRIFDEG